MKTLLLLTLAIGMMGCGTEPKVKYSYGIESITPDSLKDKKAQYIKDLVSAASLHMSAGDYESPENLVYAASRCFDGIYNVDVEGLTIRHEDIYMPQFIPFDKLTKEQKIIFNDVKLHK